MDDSDLEILRDVLFARIYIAVKQMILKARH